MSGDVRADARELLDALGDVSWRAVGPGVRNGDHWYVCEDDEAIAMISANDGSDEHLRQLRAEFIAAAPALVQRLLAESEPAPCDMRQGAPYDFAWCTTHDTTFRLGEKCKFDGREPWEVFVDEASEQRLLKVRAELTLDRTRGELDAALTTIQRMRDALPALLDEAWDDGNASGLDGWVGPGRGAGEVDSEAVSARRRSTEHLLAHALNGGGS